MNMRTDTSEQLTVSRVQAAEWATWCQAISDPTRILILNLLSIEHRPLTVGEITERLDVGQSTISHHLSKLAAVGFLLVDRVGTTSHWRVNESCIEVFPSVAQIILGKVPDDFSNALECS